MLDAARIIARAEEKAGLADSERHLHRNLEALVASINEGAPLYGAGLEASERSLVARTADRLEGLKWLRDNPDIAGETIAEPVFLTGLPRSGTTYFQYLFDRDRRFRLVRTWESITPNPPPGIDPESVIRRKAFEAELRRQSRPREVENMAALHLIDDDGPDECHTYLEQSWSAAGFLNLYDCPAYFGYLMDEADPVAAYRVHKRQLQLLQWRMPAPRWAVKYPNHVIAMDAILAVYPDAHFVMTHRDPLQTLASIAKMTLALRASRYDDPVDPRRVGKQMLHFIERHIDRIMAFSTGPDASRVTHVDYYRLVADPAKLMEEVHEGIGIDTPEDVRAAIASWRRANPKNRRGANDYALEQFGLEAGEVRERFSAYIRHFDIPDEAEGVGRRAAET